MRWAAHELGLTQAEGLRSGAGTRFPYECDGAEGTRDTSAPDTLQPFDTQLDNVRTHILFVKYKVDIYSSLK